MSCTVHVGKSWQARILVRIFLIQTFVHHTPATTPRKMSKQPSRKGKKSWRKNVDISDVQSGLEQLREEITQG
jgi:hypothetical protein